MDTVQQDKMNSRKSKFGSIATHLALLSDRSMQDLLATALDPGKSIGGVTHTLDLIGTKVFVKKIRLTDLELLPKNIHSTANLFDLPLFYQYGVGSTGFGAWRELAVHTMTTNWVLTGECSNFPLMYHWRILPFEHQGPTDSELEKLEKDVQYWDDSIQVRARLRAILEASNEIVIFMEYFPENLHDWFTRKMLANNDESFLACLKVLCYQQKIMSFMNKQGLLHFDAHYQNILTDGDQLYFSDFGLAISAQFELSNEEKLFFQDHQRYDQCYAKVNLLRFIFTTIYATPDWQTKLHDSVNGKDNQLSEKMMSMVKPLIPTALEMGSFFGKLIAESKSTLYPMKELELLETDQGKNYDLIAEGFAKLRDSFNTELKYLDVVIQHLKPNDEILDIGCGSGFPIADYLIQQGFKITGIDSSKKLLNIAQLNYPTMTCIHGDIRTVQHDYEYDAIIEWWCLFHVPQKDHETVIARFASWLKVGGIVQFTTGDTEYTDSSDSMLNQELHFYSLNRSAYQDLLIKHGFEILLCESDQETHLVWIARLLRKVES